MKTKTGIKSQVMNNDRPASIEREDESVDEKKNDVSIPDCNMSSLESRAEDLRKSLVEKQSKKDLLERDLHEMNFTIQKYQEGNSGDEGEEPDIVENGDKYLSDKDSLVFHGVEKDP